MLLHRWDDGGKKKKCPSESRQEPAAGSPLHQSVRFFQFARTKCAAKAFALQVASQNLTSARANDAYSGKAPGTDPLPGPAAPRAGISINPLGFGGLLGTASGRTSKSYNW